MTVAPPPPPQCSRDYYLPFLALSISSPCVKDRNLVASTVDENRDKKSIYDAKILQF